MALFAQIVKVADHLASVTADVVALFLELVQFLQHRERDYHLVVGKRKYRLRVVQQDVRV